MSLSDRSHLSPLVSLIVATSGTRLLELRRLLDSVRAQDTGQCEILVVDQSDGDIDELLREYPTVVHVRSHEKGLSRSRNIGIARSSGRLVAFPDDDCVLPPDYLSQIRQLRPQLHGNVLCAFGNILQIEDRKPFHPLYEIGSISRLTAFNCLKVASVGLVFDRDVFERIGVFDEDFGVGAPYGAAEETDLLLRMFDAGIESVYASHLDILHPARPKDRVSPERHRSYSEALGALARKHWRCSHNWRFLLVFLYSVFRSLGGILVALFQGSAMTGVYAMNAAAKLRGFFTYRGDGKSPNRQGAGRPVEEQRDAIYQ